MRMRSTLPERAAQLANKLGREAAASMGQCPPKRGGGDAGVGTTIAECHAER